MPSFFSRLGDTLTRLRVWTVNLLYLLLLVYILGMVGWVVWKMPGKVNPEGKVLILAPKGVIRDQAVPPSLQSLPGGDFDETQIQTRDLIRVMRAAAKDQRLAGVLVDFSEATFPGSATALQLAGELAALREATDKPVIAYSQSVTTGAYLLAAQADEVYVHPSGAVAISGLGGYRDYYRELAEKLKITIHNYSQGDFKSAVESFTRNDMSEPDRLQRRELINPIWTELKQRMAAARGVEPAVLQQVADGYPVVVAPEAAYRNLDFALEQRLIDGTKTLPQLRADMIQRFGRDEEDEERETYPHITADAYLAQLPDEKQAEDRVAVVFVEGVLQVGPVAPGVAGSEDIARLIRQARENKQTRAIVLRVNSPGGGILASDSIRDELVAAREKNLPVVVSMGDVAASGGMWVSTPADAIFAEPTTITGSIGVAVVIPTLENLFAYLGIHTDGVTTSDYAGWSLQQGVDERLDAIFAGWAGSTYDHFVDLVAASRGRTPDYIRSIAGGRVWLAPKAQELGLIDQLGTLDDAIADAAQRARTSSYSVDYVAKEPEPLIRLLQQFGVNLGELQGLSANPLSRQLSQLLAVLGEGAEPAISALCAVCMVEFE